MSHSRNTYFVSRIVAGIVCAAGALTMVFSIGSIVILIFFGSSIQAGLAQAATGRMLTIAGAGLFLSAFSLLCRAVFHMAQSSSSANGG